MVKINEMTIKLTFIEDVLGGLPQSEDIYREYIASKAEDRTTVEDEVRAVGVDEVAENGKTVFPKLADGTPFVYDYQVKGFFKDTCSALARVKGSKSSGVKAFKKIIDGNVFVKDRQNVIDMHGLLMDTCSRPLRASTPQGDRVAIASSEQIPAGSTINITIQYFDNCPVTRELLTEWLDYGSFRGLGQWRNSGKGRFSYEITAEK